MRVTIFLSIIMVSLLGYPQLSAINAEEVDAAHQYDIGPDDILDIHVIQPENLTQTVTVSPDGTITFPYIGTLSVKDRTLASVQDEIEGKLADGYMKYPVVQVSLKESRSRKFFVYGEVNKPGPYPLENNTTILRAISMAGGFTKFGSSSRVKLLRPKKDQAGYDSVKVNINGVMNGDPDADFALNAGDIVVISEGVF